MQVPSEQQGMVLPDTEEEQDQENNDTWNEQGMGKRKSSVWTLFGGNITRRRSRGDSLEDIERNSPGHSTDIDSIKSSGTWGYSGPDEVVSVKDLTNHNIRDSPYQTLLNKTNNSNKNTSNGLQQTPRQLSVLENIVLQLSPKGPRKYAKRFKAFTPTTSTNQQRLQPIKGHRQPVVGSSSLESSPSTGYFANSMLNLREKGTPSFNFTKSTPNLPNSGKHHQSKYLYHTDLENQSSPKPETEIKRSSFQRRSTKKQIRPLPTSHVSCEGTVRCLSLPDITDTVAAREVSMDDFNKCRWRSETDLVDITHSSTFSSDDLRYKVAPVTRRIKRRRFTLEPHQPPGTSFQRDQHGLVQQASMTPDHCDLPKVSNETSSKTLWTIVKEIQNKQWF
ncbi:uncharacterized protein LOC111089871 [Limulus polyphemus]|uniref:Uncharacterized protein LOC111089871 n=1 Tax=Limulus polyphemus TaxID=6850 RepID=A0ABM1TSF6_LIMPO|nr:uncharacterized protein LOC111089871 [Limulus polyphemus]